MVARYWFRCGRPPKLSQTENIMFFLDIPTVTQHSDKPLPIERSLGNGKTMGGERSLGKTLRPEAALRGDDQRGAIIRKPSFRTGKRAVIVTEDHSMEGLARWVLSRPATLRTEKQIKQLVEALQVFSKFSGYPPHIQTRLCQHGWYARFDPSRIMVRHQQPAQIYYFLLSGLAISRAVDETQDLSESRRRQRAIFLRKGDTLGEKELLKDMKRDVTVVTKETVEVLGVDKEDFLETFRMVTGEKQEFLPFLKTVGEMSCFPLELLQAHFFASTVQNYRKGTVITRNSNEADWVYVVKQGACQVFVAMRRNHGNRGNQGNQDVTFRPEVDTLVVPTKFPPISSAKSTSELSVHKTDSYSRKLKESRYSNQRPPQRSVSESHLPHLPQGTNLVSRPLLDDATGADSLHTMPHSDNETRSWRKHTKSCSYILPHQEQDDTTGSPANLTCLETLTEGATFGLQTLIYEDDTTLILVSQGSECVMVSKKFLQDHLDSTTISKLRNKVPPYRAKIKELKDTKEKSKIPRLKKEKPPERVDGRAPWDNYYQKLMKKRAIES